LTIQRKITGYFSAAIIVLVGLVLLFVFTLFSKYREEEFQQRLKLKILTSLRLLADLSEEQRQIFESLESESIHDILDEKLMLFNIDRELLYESSDDLVIFETEKYLNNLSPENPWLESHQNQYDLVGVCVSWQDQYYLGLSKAYDAYGYSKLTYLRNIFAMTFLVFSLLVILLSLYLSKRIASPIKDLAIALNNFDPVLNSSLPKIKPEHSEMNILMNRFNDMIQRTQEAFAFQKHAAHHISHSLKTPIAIMLSQVEAAANELNFEKLPEFFKRQRESLRRLGAVIEAMLVISKADAGLPIQKEKIRLDELLFDAVHEVSSWYPEFAINVNFPDSKEFGESSRYEIEGNKELLLTVFQNLLINAVRYSSEKNINIKLQPTENGLTIEFINIGRPIEIKERPYLFNHFFRGENSHGKEGFGLGLVFVQKISSLHNTHISYECEGEQTNIFRLHFSVKPIAQQSIDFPSKKR